MKQWRKTWPLLFNFVRIRIQGVNLKTSNPLYNRNGLKYKNFPTQVNFYHNEKVLRCNFCYWVLSAVVTSAIYTKILNCLPIHYFLGNFIVNTLYEGESFWEVTTKNFQNKLLFFVQIATLIISFFFYFYSYFKSTLENIFIRTIKIFLKHLMWLYSLL